MNRDLIDRAELPTVRIEIPKRLDDETCRIISGLVEAFQTVIKSAPTVDAVEVVRCRDCKFSRHVHRLDGSVFEGTLHCRMGRGYQQNIFGEEYSVISPNNFCASGRRKQDAEVEG